MGGVREELAAGVKESPGRAGALGLQNEELSSFLDAPILSHGTNQARRGSNLAGRLTDRQPFPCNAWLASAYPSDAQRSL
jgi:hypothetical protein